MVGPGSAGRGGHGGTAGPGGGSGASHSSHGSGHASGGGSGPAPTGGGTGAAPPGRVQRYRFKVRTADGREVTSAVAEVLLPPDLEAPQWAQPQHSPGEVARMRLSAPGRDAETINFVVERRVGESWEPIGHTSGEVRDGAVEVEHEMPHLPPPESASDAGDVEYHNLPPSRGTAAGGSHGSSGGSSHGGSGGSSHGGSGSNRPTL